MNDFPTDDDPFHVLCTYSPGDMFYYLYEIDLGNIRLLKQRDIDLVPWVKDLENSFPIPSDLVGKIMYYIMESYIQDKDPGNGLEYAFLNRSTLNYVYYKLFGRDTFRGELLSTKRKNGMMIKRLGHFMRQLYHINDQMENLEDPHLGCKISLDLIHPYYHCFYNEYYNCSIYPYLVKARVSKNSSLEGGWRLMTHEEAYVGAAYTPWCKGYEDKGIWKVYELAWPLVYFYLHFSEARIDKKSFQEFYRLIKLMFGKYTVVYIE